MKNKKLLLSGIISVLLLSMMGTYAYYTGIASNNNIINATAASANLELTVTKSAGGTTLVPQLTDYLQSALTGTNSTSCIDANGNTVCQVYTITIKNTGTATAVLTGTLEITAASMDNLKWEILTGVKTRNSNPTTYSKTDTTLVSSLTLAKNATQTYYVAVWIAETGSAQSDSGNFNGTISFTYASGEGVTSSFLPLPATQTLTTLGINTSSVKTLGANYWMSTETDPGIFSYTEDNKLNYFWRGQVNNNWVKFGTETISSCTYNGHPIYTEDTDSGYWFYDSQISQSDCTSKIGICYNEEVNEYNLGITQVECSSEWWGDGYSYVNASGTYSTSVKDIYWRIVRITDTGEIRMIYSGNTAPESYQQYHNNGKGINNDGEYAFNNIESNAEYVGYQYTLGSGHGTGTNSYIKNIVDSWYTNNLSSNYETNISTSTYCYDRTTYSGTVAGYNYSGTGVGTTSTWFSAAHRLISSSSLNTGGTGPQIYCSDKNDNYSLKSGLLSADEAAIAGIWYDGKNFEGDENNYLYGHYWLGSPFSYNRYTAGYGFAIRWGSFNSDLPLSANSFAVRPVISLTPSVTISGTGTYDDPYTIS